MRRATAALIAVAVVLIPSVAHAETRTIWDGPGRDQQGSANSLTRATMTYETTQALWRIKVQEPRRDRTRAFGTVYWPNGTSIRLLTGHVHGERVTVADIDDGVTPTRFTDGVSSTWNYHRDVITLRLTSHLLDADRASLDAFTVTKGRNHGPFCRSFCNDDYVAIRLHQN